MPVSLVRYGSLLRPRLAAAALLLSVAYTILVSWHLFVGCSAHPRRAVPLIARSLAAGDHRRPLVTEPDRVLYSLASPRSSSRFSSALTVLIIAISEYTINLSLMQRDDYPAMVAFVKNGVIQMVVLMFLYGTFIPNRPTTVAWVVLGMALAPLFTLALLDGASRCRGSDRPFQIGRANGNQRSLPLHRRRDGRLWVGRA